MQRKEYSRYEEYKESLKGDHPAVRLFSEGRTDAGIACLFAAELCDELIRLHDREIAVKCVNTGLFAIAPEEYQTF
jgi:hypothetical protein